jgi:single-strand DNA-binding protein
MQQITITGYLSRDAEQSTTQGGDKVTRWNVPVKQGFGDREQTNWFRVSIWGKRSDFAAKSRKGDFVAVTGELTIGDYQGKPQYDVRASDFSAVNRSPTDQREPDGSQGSPPDYGDDLDDEIPFATRNSIF